MSCLTDDEAMALARGDLLDERREPVERHLDTCPACRLVVAEVAKVLFPSDAPAGDVAEEIEAGPLPPGSTVARYRINRVLGAGAVGLVYEAYDPELKRKTALKLLRPIGGARASVEEARSRLLREAQSMAQIAHPNVVRVYDVGTFEEKVYVVMEYVEGETLTAWLGRPRGWREILDVFVAAARGLAAAHAAKLVHRDFKPDNVLVGTDGAVRVTDFGLAQSLVEGGSAVAGAGMVAGTRAYMAPEQLAGKPADARTDQFSYCVALHEALFGRQAAPSSAPAARALIVDGPSPLPIKEALRRGLRSNPDERHGSMEDLLAALSRSAAATAGGGRPIWRGLLLAGIGLGALTALSGVWRPWQPAGSAKRTPAGVAPRSTGPQAPKKVSVTCGEPPSAGSEGQEVRVGQRWCLTRIDTELSWFEARQACEELGANLATCRSPSDCDVLETTALPRRLFWIGLSDLRSEGVLEWVTDEVLPFPRERWGPAGPDTGGDDRDCVAVQGPVRKDSGQSAPPADPAAPSPASWSTQDCSRRLGAICERTPWIGVRGRSRVYRVLRQPLSWDDAHLACEKLDARLATFADSDDLPEFKFVHSRVAIAVHEGLWIGATDREEEGAFRWITGEPVRREAFQGREPDNAHGAQDCVLLRVANWRLHDRACGDRYSALCSKEIK
jgi:anti-sigma factor RsiW